jgi:hypothetical protein
VNNEEYIAEIPNAIYYNHVREIGRPVYHTVVLYSSYSAERGCIGKVLLECEGTIAHCLKEMRKWPISKEHCVSVHRLMSYRQDGVMPSDLKFRRC